MLSVDYQTSDTRNESATAIQDRGLKFLLLIPDGVGIRNFLCSQFIDHLLRAGEVIVWHALAPASLAPYRERWGAQVTWVALPSYREGLSARVLRQAKMYGQLYWKREAGLQIMLKFMRPSGRWLNYGIAYLARALGWLGSSPAGVRVLDNWHATAASWAGQLVPYTHFLAQQKPDVVFCTTQRASRAVPAMLAARQLGIPTSTFVYSWDNLPKGRMAVHADHFVVWSDFMQQELRSYYPEIAADRIHVAGTPQFEHYFNPTLVQPRAAFLSSLGLDPARPVICFSGCDLTSSPHDPVYLADLAAALRELPPAQRPQILFRRTPVDTSPRYQWVFEQYPEIAVSTPVWSAGRDNDWTQVIPTIADIALLVNVVRHADAVVNVGSTMAMDFAILDKPGIYLAYNPPGVGPASGWSVHDAYRLPHFRLVHELQPIHWVRRVEDLSSTVLHVLANPQETAPARQAWLTKLMAQPLAEASLRCCATLQRIGRAAAAGRVDRSPHRKQGRD